MGVHQRERGVVADRADVAEMIGDALDLGHQRPQPRRPRRRDDADRRFDGAGEGDLVGDRAVAADPAGEFRAAREIGARHQPLDALVNVAEPLLQPHDRLAAGVEAEMARLDDPGMHRPDRNLMQPDAFGAEKRVALRLAAARRGARPERMAERPAAMVEPRPRVGRAPRLQAR